MRRLFLALLIAWCWASLVEAQSPRDYIEVDRHALAASPEVEINVKSLATYLKNGRPKTVWNPRVKFWNKNISGEADTAREIFRWITDRITYEDIPRDPTKNFRGEHASDGNYWNASVSPAATLRRRKTHCEGYAILFHSLALEAGLDDLYCGGYVFLPDYGSQTHAWNAVKIGGDWLMVDACWGAGGARKFGQEWFLVPQEHFLLSHFPSEYWSSEFQCYEFLKSYDHKKLLQIKKALRITD